MIDREDLEGQTVNFGDMQIVRTDPYGFWYFKKVEGGVTIPTVLKGQAFTSQTSAEVAYNQWKMSKDAPTKPASKKD